MVALTNSQYLPYPTGTDRRCDAPGTWETFAELLEGKLSALERYAARLSPTVPIAIVSKLATEPLQTAGSYPITFDTVMVDTDGMTDLSVNPFVITPRRSGRYQIVVTAMIEALSAVGQTPTIAVWGGTRGSDPVDTESSFAFGPQYPDNNYAWKQSLLIDTFSDWWPEAPTSTGTSPWFVEIGGQVPGTLLSMQFGAFWTRDLP